MVSTCHFVASTCFCLRAHGLFFSAPEPAPRKDAAPKVESKNCGRELGGKKKQCDPRPRVDRFTRAWPLKGLLDGDFFSPCKGLQGLGPHQVKGESMLVFLVGVQHVFFGFYEPVVYSARAWGSSEPYALGRSGAACGRRKTWRRTQASGSSGVRCTGRHKGRRKKSRACIVGHVGVLRGCSIFSAPGEGVWQVHLQTQTEAKGALNGA